jgi:CXXX repeat modification system protein
MCADKPDRATPDRPQHKLVGQVSPEERDEIRALFERRNGLAELCRSLVSMNAGDLQGSPLYERLVADMGKTATDFQQWWLGKAEEHQWEGREGGHWTIDFGSCDIFLEAPV